jgi:hypothetical protein
MDFGIVEIDFRLLERRLRDHHVGLGGSCVRGALVDRRLRNVKAAAELLTPLELQHGIGLGGLGLCNRGELLVDQRLVGRLLDAKQEIAFLHLLPFGEGALLDEAGDPRDDFDLVDRDDAADEFGGIGHLAVRHRHDGHRGRGRRRALRKRARTKGQQAEADNHRAAASDARSVSRHGFLPFGSSTHRLHQRAPRRYRRIYIYVKQACRQRISTNFRSAGSGRSPASAPATKAECRKNPQAASRQTRIEFPRSKLDGPAAGRRRFQPSPL